jgi:magnesium chelatase subunit D
MNAISPAEHRITAVLRCMAVDHRIGGLLLFSTQPGLLSAMGRWLARTMAAGAGEPALVVAGSWLREDDLWLRARLVDGRFHTAPGLLVEIGAPPVVLVPDLARAGLAIARAAVTLIGAEVATAERHGYSRTWRPRARWLAATDPYEAAGLSRHLLDRFPVRIHADVAAPALGGDGCGDWAGLP